MSRLPAREQAQVNIRMPDELRARIKASADSNNRSMNAEIVAVLELRFPKPASFEDLATKLYDLGNSMLLEEDKSKREKIAEHHRETLAELLLFHR